MVFSQLDENVGFELLCRSRQVLAIMNFLFDYRWLDDTERVICSLNRADCDGYWEGLFDFSVVLLCSSSRVHAEFGRELLKVVREKMQIDGAYWKFLLEVYMKNSAIGAGFVYDLTGFVDCQNLWAVVERYKHSRNISCLTKASCAQHIYLKAHVDANSFISNVIKKLDKIDKSSFQDGSTLFYIKTLKLLCEENHNEKIFYTLSNTINTLLSNTNHPTHERKLYESSLSVSCSICLISHPLHNFSGCSNHHALPFTPQQNQPSRNSSPQLLLPNNPTIQFQTTRYNSLRNTPKSGILHHPRSSIHFNRHVFQLPRFTYDEHINHPMLGRISARTREYLSRRCEWGAREKCFSALVGITER